jgi:transaldolase
MRLFIDSADPREIADCAATGLIDGVTTNPAPATEAGPKAG